MAVIKLLTPTTPPLSVSRLLEVGYLPEVLPPCFRSTSLGAAFLPGSSPPAEFTASTKNGVPRASKSVTYMQTRVGSLRRRFAIPNPVHYFRLATCVLDNWEAIRDLTAQSPISLTKPVLGTGSRCFEPAVRPRERPLHRARVRATSRFLLKTDIARFFPSIYTHSVPWAIHSKAAAKKDKSHALWGNAIDTCLRNVQDTQTSGIPIGQDVSRLIAEVLLARVEVDLARRKWPRGMRCVDDYEIAFDKEVDAHDFLNDLQSALSVYELELNRAKTAVLALPQLLIDPWDAELRTLLPLRDDAFCDSDDDADDVWGMHYRRSISATVVINYFNRAIAIQLARPRDSVLRFAIRLLQHVDMDADAWTVCQSLLTQCAISRPETLAPVARLFERAVLVDGRALDRPPLTEALCSIVMRGTAHGRSSDVAWALWCALLFQIKLPQRVVAALSGFEDSSSCSLAYVAQDAGLLRTRFAPMWLTGLIRGAEAYGGLFGEHWLAVYEASRNGWVPRDTVKDDCFRYLLDKDVHFLDTEYAGRLVERLRSLSLAERRRYTAADEDLDNDDSSGADDAHDSWMDPF